MVKTPQKRMMRLLNNWLLKMAKGMGRDNSEFSVSISPRNKKNISLSTDGYFYNQLFDPSMSEMPYLIREANAEFGHNAPVPTGYEDQEKFGKFLKSHGWNYEPYGMGVIDIYSEE